jgi:signal recognition particle GTPase
MNEEVEVTEVDPAVATDPAASPDLPTAGDEVVTEPVVEKTFTQAELDSIVQKEKAKAEAKAERKAARAYREGVERAAPQTQSAQPVTDSMPKREAYATDEAWLDARDAHRDAKRDAAQASERQKESQEKLAKTTAKIYAQAEKIVGFDRDAFDELPITPTLAGALIESDIAPQLMAYMADNPDEVERIVALSPARQAVELGKLEVKLSAAKPKTTNAPAPITPVGSRGKPSSSALPSDEDDIATWMRKEQARTRGR